ncbi:hypothetical protein KJ671_02020 [Patescibacteria group bacterium]|nr:hypothetical protein [Patescibacteria group bacterium]
MWGMKRLFKQFLYGGIVLLIISAILLIIYWNDIFIAPTCLDNIQNQNEEGIDCGAVCGISCEEKYLEDLSYSNLSIFRLDDLVSLYFDLKNPNPNFGLRNFKYQIDLYGFANKLLKSIKGESFIYPEQTKKIVEISKVLGEVESARISFSNINWESSLNFRSISLENKNMRTYKDGDSFIISGKIKNLNSFIVPRVIINGFLMDSSNNILGVSKTDLLNQLDPFAEKEYRVFIEINPGFEKSVDFSKSTTSIYSFY